MSDPIADLLAAQSKGGADPIAAMLAQQAGSKEAAPAPAAAKPVPPPADNRGMLGNMGDMASAFGHNLMKGFHGAAQMVEHGIGTGLESIAPDSAPTKYWNGVTQSDDAALAKWERDYQSAVPDSPGAITGAIAGQVANPINRMVKMPAGATLLGMAGRGAAQGAISGLATPTTETADGDFAEAKARQAGFGAVAGGTLAPAGKLLADKVVAPLAGKAVALVDQLRGKVPVADLESAAQKAGVELGDIPDNIRATVQREADKALASGKDVDLAAALRKAKFEALDIKPMLGQITRDPVQYTHEMDIRGLPGGKAVADLMDQQNKGLIKVLGQAGADTAPTPYAGGTSIMARLLQDDAARNKAVGDAYGAVRDSAGRSAPLDHVAFSKSANDALDAQMLGTSLPPNIRELLNKVSAGELPLTANTAVQLDKVMTAAQRTAPAEGQLAIRQVRNALNDATPAQGAAAETMSQYAAARALARDRFTTIDENPGLKAALNEVDPEKFVRKYVINGSVDDVRNLIKISGDQAGTIKQQVVSWLQNKALNGATPENAKFSQAAYNKALSNFEPETLKSIFTADEMGMLHNLRDVGAYIQTQPAGSAVNNSNTGAAVGQLLSKIGKLPYVSEYVVKPLKTVHTSAQADAATAAQVPAQTTPGARALATYLRRGVVPPAVAATQRVDDR